MISPFSSHPAGLAFPTPAALCMATIMDRVSSQPAPGKASELVPLFGAIAGGDRSALARLYHQTSAKLYGISLRILRSDADAEEVLQDIFVSVWRNAERFDSAKSSPITWLSVLARNRSIDRLRRRRLVTEDIDAAHQVADDQPSAPEVIESKQEVGRLNGCLDELGDRQRTMIRAAFLDGSTYRELAEREAVPLGTMKSWIRRGLQQLKGCLEQ